MKCKKIKTGYVSILCTLLLLICPTGVIAVEDIPSFVETQNVAYGEKTDDVIPVILSADIGALFFSN
ncbi:MAG: hypothetical protein LBD34_02130 [Puniceicoccales bacterium]|jgi:hypothetical protein|nr:hypothetical protein [Puniceicoccales bacterium]